MKLKIGALIGLLLMLIGLLALGVACYIRFESFLPLVFLVIADLIILIWYIKMLKRERKEKFCNECKQQFDFENDVEYEEINTYTKNHPYNPSRNGKQKITSLMYNVRFECTCSNCGRKKTFTKELYGGSEYSDGTLDIKDPEETIRSYFRTEGLSLNSGKNIFTSFITGIVSIILAIVIGFGTIPFLDSCEGGGF